MKKGCSSSISQVTACKAAIQQSGRLRLWRTQNSSVTLMEVLSGALLAGGGDSVAGSPVGAGVQGSDAVQRQLVQAAVPIIVQWSALPYSAELQVGLKLTAESNVDVLQPLEVGAPPALFVFGVAEGQCPPGAWLCYQHLVLQRALLCKHVAPHKWWVYRMLCNSLHVLVILAASVTCTQ
jgi:hypothetical protein